MHTTRAQSPFSLPLPVQTFWVVSAVLTMMCSLAVDFSREVFRLPYPYISQFFPFNAYIDLFDFRARFYHFHHLDFFSVAHSRGAIFSYPAPVGLLYALFFWPNAHIHLFFTALTTLPVVVLVVMLGRAMMRRGLSAGATAFFLLTTCLMSYPFWFNYFLANMEVCIFILLAFGVIAYLRGHLYLAAALIGVAGSMKIFPLILLGLFFARRQYRQFAFSLLVAAATFFGSIWMECPSFFVARAGMADGAKTMNDALIRKWLPLENGFDHSLFAFFKRLVHRHFQGDVVPVPYLNAYLLLAAFTGLTLYFLYIRRLPLLNQILSLYLAAVLLPPMSHHYTLMHLYLPWGLLVLFAIDSARQGKHVPGLLSAFVCFGVLFSSESEFILHAASLSGQIKAMVLVALWYVSMKFPFDRQVAEESILNSETQVKAETHTPIYAR